MKIPTNSIGAFSIENLEIAEPSPIATWPKRDALPSLVLGAIIVPERKVQEGVLVRSYGDAWLDIIRLLSDDWSAAFEIKPEKWEEILAGAFNKEGYEVTLTPRSGGRGRDLIALPQGWTCFRMDRAEAHQGLDKLVLFRGRTVRRLLGMRPVRFACRRYRSGQ